MSTYNKAIAYRNLSRRTVKAISSQAVYLGAEDPQALLEKYQRRRSPAVSLRRLKDGANHEGADEIA
jgi:hypothetical protein